MYKVTFKFENSEDVTVFAAFGESLLEVARKTNVAIDAPCSGNASCGKCKVKLIGGELDSKKTRHISDEEYAAGWRLACVSKISGDVEVLVPDELPAPVTEGEIIGSVVYYINGEVFDLFPVYLLDTSPGIDYPWCLEQVIQRWIPSDYSSII